MCAELTALSPEAWTSPTNCPPWLVRDLAAHIVSSGEGAVAAIRQGIAGTIDSGITTEARERRQAWLVEAGPGSVVADALAGVTTMFESTYADLDEAGLSAICFHRRGNRPAALVHRAPAWLRWRFTVGTSTCRSARFQTCRMTWRC